MNSFWPYSTFYASFLSWCHDLHFICWIYFWPIYIGYLTVTTVVNNFTVGMQQIKF